MSKSYNCPIEKIQLGTTTQGQGGTGRNVHEWALPIHQRSSITGTLTIWLFSVISWAFVGGSYPSAGMQSVYSTTHIPADWENCDRLFFRVMLINILGCQWYRNLNEHKIDVLTLMTLATIKDFTNFYGF